MPTLTITRTFEPITKTIDDCRDCPYFGEERDMGSTLAICNHPKYDRGTIAYNNVLDCTTFKRNDDPYISPLCPELPK